MEFVILKKSLEDAAKQVARLINPKHNLPILTTIAMEVNERDLLLTLTASDGESWASKRVFLKSCNGSGKFCVSSQNLVDSLSEIPDQDVTINADAGTSQFILKHSRGETEFPVQYADEYPFAPDGIGTYSFSVNTGIIRRTFKRSMFAVAADDIRPVLATIYVNLKGPELDIVATDGRRLIRNRENVEATCKDGLCGSFLVPRKIAKLIPDLLGSDETCDVAFSDAAAVFEQSDVTITFSLTEGKYPNYDIVIPIQSHTFACDRTSLLKAIRNVSHFADGTYHTAVLSMGDENKLGISSQDIDYSTRATDTVKIQDGSTKRMSIGIGGDFLVECLQQIAEPEITFGYTSPSHAITIVPRNPYYVDEEVTMLVMPVMVRND